MPFQKNVYIQPAPAVAGDFASVNPRATLLAGEGALVAATGGVTVGRFVWVASGAVSNVGTGSPNGFLHREQQALMTVYLAETSNVVQEGTPVSVHVAGDFWATTKTNATVGQTVYADRTTGEVATGSSTPNSFVGTASFATNVMTVTAVTSGTLKVGDVVTSASVTAGTTITALVTGTGGTGTYTLSTSPGTIAAQAATATRYESTSFKVASAASANELIKISTWGV